MKVKKLLAILLATMMTVGSAVVPTYAVEPLLSETVETADEFAGTDVAAALSEEAATSGVAKIGDMEYNDLAAAIDAVPSDGTQTTIKIIENIDITLNENLGNTGKYWEIGENQNITIDLNSYSIYVKEGVATDVGKEYPLALFENKGTLVIDDTSSNASGNITFTHPHYKVYNSDYTCKYDNTRNVFANYGSLILKNGLIQQNFGEEIEGNFTQIYTVDNYCGGTFTMEGGKLYNNCQCNAIRQVAHAGATNADNVVNIKGGTVYGYSPIWIETWEEGQKATLNISGGTINTTSKSGATQVYNSSTGTATTINITGGTLNDALTVYAGTCNISGDAVINGTVRLKGTTSISGGTFNCDVISYLGKNTKKSENFTIADGTFANGVIIQDYYGLGKTTAISGGKFATGNYGSVYAVYYGEDKKWHYTPTCITGGTFNSDVSKYIATDKMLVKNSDGAYVVTDVEKVTEKFDNDNITNEEKVDTINSVVISKNNTAVTEKVVETIKTLPVEKKEEITPAKVEEIIATKTESDVKTATAATTGSEDEGTVAVTATLKSIDSSLTLSIQPKTENSQIKLPAGTKAARFEVKVEKDGIAVTETDVPMLLTFKVADVNKVKSVIRYHDGKQETVPFTKDAEQNLILITAAKFSEYLVVEPATPTTDSAVLTFGDEFDGDGKCNLYLVGDADATVTDFESGEFTITNTETSGKVNIEIAGATGLTIDEVKDGYYKIHRTTGAALYPTVDAANHRILLGTITLTGTGKGQIYAENIKMYRKSRDNENLAVEIPTTSDTVGYDIQAETEDLTIKVTFPNAVENQKTAYQDMKITISGGDLADPLSYNLGSDASANVVWDNTTDATYTLTVADKLTKNVAYTVKVEGAGYRTARYTVNMTGAKTLNFWNNVKDTAINVEEDVTTDTTKKNVTFLAGDIVKDNQINIYDLSAVVSYFGQTGISVDAASDYAKYDLNRDGKIDSKDIAYVLVSWGN